MKNSNICSISMFIAILFLPSAILSSCNKYHNTKEYKGQELNRFLSILSNRTYTKNNQKVERNDTLSIYVDNQGSAILVNDIPINENEPDSGNIRYSPPMLEKYEYNYDADGHLISATTSATDTPQYKFIWKDNLVTDIIVTGDYHGNTQCRHIEYDLTINSSRSGIALFMDLFDTKKLIAKYLTGEVGGYVPSHPIAKIYVDNDKYENDTLTFSNIIDRNNRLSEYSVKSHTINTSRHFDYPN